MTATLRPTVLADDPVVAEVAGTPRRSRRHRTGTRYRKPDLGSAPFRRDIQGLRAVAVLAVVLSHAGVPGFDGGYVGVDVFFVISGFLISEHLLRELGATGTIRFRDFYARRIRRLLPAAVTVVVVSGVVSYLFESSLAARHLAEDALWAAAYGMNIQLAAKGTDYFASESVPSTLQHFWSLSVEEQFYFVWPLLLLVSGVLLRRRGPRRLSRWKVGICLALVVAASLGLSIWQTGTTQSWAYFGLHTRAWELAVGALIAVGLPVVRRIPVPWGRAASWAGLGCIAAAVAVFDESTAFPGYAAVLPVAGAALVILGGTPAGGRGAERLLGLPPFQTVGALSYSWYLWHWPVLILMPSILGWEPTPRNNLFVVFVAFLLAVIGYSNVEVPLRTARAVASTGRGLALGVVLPALLAVCAVTALAALPQAVGFGAAVTAQAADGATVRDSLSLRAAPSNLTPTPDVATDDVPVSRDNGCHLLLKPKQVKRPCAYGDLNGSRTMVLLGDSHADQWLPALDQIASDSGYRLLGRTKSACPSVEMTVRDGDLGREYTECTTWRAQVMDEIEQVHPDVVVMSSSFGVGNKSAGDWTRATTRTVSSLTEQGIKVVFINDTPRREEGQTGPDCVAAHLDDVSACIVPQDRAQPFHTISSAVLEAVQRSGGLVVDLTSSFCADQQCPAVIGNYLVYRDQSHISASYVRFIEPELERAMALH